MIQNLKNIANNLRNRSSIFLGIYFIEFPTILGYCEGVMRKFWYYNQKMSLSNVCIYIAKSYVHTNGANYIDINPVIMHISIRYLDYSKILSSNYRSCQKKKLCEANEFYGRQRERGELILTIGFVLSFLWSLLLLSLFSFIQVSYLPCHLVILLSSCSQKKWMPGKEAV